MNCDLHLLFQSVLFLFRPSFSWLVFSCQWRQRCCPPQRGRAAPSPCPAPPSPGRRSVQPPWPGPGVLGVTVAFGTLQATAQTLLSDTFLERFIKTTRRPALGPSAPHSAQREPGDFASPRPPPRSHRGQRGGGTAFSPPTLGSFSFCLHDTGVLGERPAAPAGARRSGHAPHVPPRSLTLFLSWLCIVVLDPRSIC